MTARRRRLSVVPVTLHHANAFVRLHHRHMRHARGCFFCVGVAADGVLCGVMIVGRPNAHALQDGFSAQVLRCATDGTPNACSKLKGAAWVAARALGYRVLWSYTLPEEGGASMRASGFVEDGITRGGSWSRRGRERQDNAPTCRKIRWKLVA